MLNNLKSIKTKNKRRIGRGIGSSKGGHTVGRGQKGQKSRSGYKSPRPGFEGGAMPLARRIPKLKGFSRGEFKNAKDYFVVNVMDLNVFKDSETVNLETLQEKGIIKSKSRNIQVKILGKGELKRKLTIEGIQLSKGAIAQIEKIGGHAK